MYSQITTTMVLHGYSVAISGSCLVCVTHCFSLSVFHLLIRMMPTQMIHYSQEKKVDMREGGLQLK